jgi:hypothetical protein
MKLPQALKAAFFYCFVLCIRAYLPAQDHTALLKKTLREQRIGFQEAYFFAKGSEENNGFSLLIRPAVGTAAAAENRASSQNMPVCVIAVPPEESDAELSTAAQTMLHLVNQLHSEVNSGEFSLPVRLFIVFLGQKDALYLHHFSGSESEAADAWTLDEGIDNTAFLFFAPHESQSLAIHYRTSQIRSPLNMIKSLTRLCKSLKLPFALVHKADGESAAFLDYAGVLEAGALYIGGSPSTGDTIAAETLASLLLRFLANLDVSPLDADYHYSVVMLAGRAFFISETAKVMAVPTGAGIIMMAVLIFLLRQRIQTLRQKKKTHAPSCRQAELP